VEINSLLSASGGSDGIGFETAMELARRGARVIIASRQRSKGETAVQIIMGQSFIALQNSFLLQPCFTCLYRFMFQNAHLHVSE
jgi:short chain dehydrogenase